jgi:4-oxalocrotonate tautomerase
MPIINVKMTHEDGGATKEQKEQLAQKLTQAFAEVFHRGAKTAVVVIEEVSCDNYAIGGKTVSTIRKEERL